MNTLDQPLKAKSPIDVFWQLSLKADEIPFLSMLTKKAQQGLLLSLVEHLLVEEK